ncbi:MAG: nucleoside-triphosphatase [Desulfurococcaceae archaeon]
MEPLRLVITGRPGSGKSTLLMKIVDHLRGRGLVVGGVVTPEVRGGSGFREGFKMRDLMSGEEVWLARRGYPSRLRVGSYGVLIDADAFASRALSSALEAANVIAIDEVGPMELLLPSFKSGLLNVLRSHKPVLLVVHYRLNEPEIVSALRGAERVEVTFHNRQSLAASLPQAVYARITKNAAAGR